MAGLAKLHNILEQYDEAIEKQKTAYERLVKIRESMRRLLDRIGIIETSWNASLLLEEG